MFSQYLRSIDFITVYPIVSLVVFMTGFIGVVVWALRADDGYIRSMENLPLDAAPDNDVSHN